MTFFPRVLGRIALACLLCQMAGVTLVQATLFARVGAEALECTCSHGDHAMCPMHHRASASKTGCAMRGAPDPAVVLVSTLLGCTGMMPTTHAWQPPAAAGITYLPVSFAPITGSRPPAAPPPRG